MSKLKIGQPKSIADLRASLKKGGGSTYLTRVPADGSLVVRFLTEPTEWVSYGEHYDPDKKFYPCSESCEGCRAGDRPSARYLANALVVSEDRVVPLVLAKTLAANAVRKYDRYGTMTDRNYEIIRSGTGLDTTYEIDPEMPSKIRLDRYELIDLVEQLQEQLDGGSSNGAAAGGAAKATKTNGTKPEKKGGVRVIRKR